MGNCCGGARSTYQSGSSRARREQTWQATGLIVLRDSNLKVCRRKSWLCAAQYIRMHASDIASCAGAAKKRGICGRSSQDTGCNQ